MSSKPKITIRDVAERSGYSTYTVSSVLNNKGDIGQDASEKIRMVARQLNYGILGTVPAQRRMTARCIGIVLPDANCLQVSFYNRALTSFRAVASQHDYDCKLFTEKDILSRTDTQKTGGPGIFGCKGLILFCPWNDYKSYMPILLQQGIAIALIRRDAKQQKGLFQISDNQDETIQQLVSYLHDQCGCKKFAFVAPNSHGEKTVHLEKWTKVFKELIEGRLAKIQTLMVQEAPNKQPDVYDPLGPFLRKKYSGRQAVVAWSDICAVRTLSYLQKEGFQVPDDVMLTGYNNDPFGIDISPTLTTVNTPVEEMVEQAFKYLMNYSKEGKLPSAKTQMLQQQLIPRNTTREL